MKPSPIGRRLFAVRSRLTACLVMLLAIGLSANTVLADPSQAAEVKPGGIVTGTLDNAQDATPKLTLAASREDGKPVEFSLDPQSRVLLNGSFVGLKDLKSGDDIKLTTDADGRPIVVATRSKPGIIMGTSGNTITLTTDYLDKFSCSIKDAAKITLNGAPANLADLKVGDEVSLVADKNGEPLNLSVTRKNLFMAFWDNFRSNLFKPLLLFFYLGFAIPLLKIAFEFPKQIYQGLTIYLLIAIGWHGGEELALLSGGALQQALSFVAVGLVTNTLIGIATYFILRRLIPRMRKVDSATVAAYYGSDSAGTFVTCLGVLQAAHIAFAAYMPVMLAAMEVPGCLVGLYLVSRLRKAGMDAKGNMPGEEGYDANTIPSLYGAVKDNQVPDSYPGTGTSSASGSRLSREGAPSGDGGSSQIGSVAVQTRETEAPAEDHLDTQVPGPHHPWKVLHEVFLNPGIILLFGGIFIGFVSRSQGMKVVQADDQLFISMFQGMLCLFLLEMGMTAAKRLPDLKTASWKFVAFGLTAPSVFACFGMFAACAFSHVVNQPLQLGTYVLFAVLCAAASYIAVPAIHRIAIPEASPTLPLAASLGLTFSFNVTIGIPLYLVIAQQIIRTFPVGM